MSTSPGANCGVGISASCNTYLYHAVDKAGRTVDFRLSERRDVAAAKAFFRNAMKRNRTPRVITLDAYAASHRAIADLKTEGRMPKRVRVRRVSI